MQVTPVPSTLFLIFTIAVVVSVVIQGAVFLGLYIAVSKALTKITGITQDLTTKANPIIADVRSIVSDVTPKVKTISGNLVDISETVKGQTKHVNSTVDDVVDKTRAQASKVDEMVSAVLDSISHAGTTVQEGVTKPVRKVSAVVTGLRVGLETLFSARTAKTGANGGYRASATERTTPFTTGSSTSEDRAIFDEERELHRRDQTIQPPPNTSSSL